MHERKLIPLKAKAIEKRFAKMHVAQRKMVAKKKPPKIERVPTLTHKS